MMRFFFLSFVCLLAAAPVRADDSTRALQSELKTQGFYYGELDGAPGPGLSAALKRYQIRNGLEVTGTATPETLGALNLGGSPAPERERSPAEPVEPSQRQPEPAPRSPVDLRKKPSVTESDQRALREEAPSTVRRAPRDPSASTQAPGYDRVPGPPSVPRYADIFAGSPFASAPPQLQDQTLRAAQRQLAAQGFYAAPVDGQPGPATTDAIVMYQRSLGIRRTGRLDFETLNAMRLTPGAGSVNPVLKPFNAGPQPRR